MNFSSTFQDGKVMMGHENLLISYESEVMAFLQYLI